MFAEIMRLDREARQKPVGHERLDVLLEPLKSEPTLSSEDISELHGLIDSHLNEILDHYIKEENFLEFVEACRKAGNPLLGIQKLKEKRRENEQSDAIRHLKLYSGEY